MGPENVFKFALKGIRQLFFDAIAAEDHCLLHGVYHDTAVIAMADMLFNLMAQCDIESPIEIIVEILYIVSTFIYHIHLQML